MEVTIAVLIGIYVVVGFIYSRMHYRRRWGLEPTGLQLPITGRGIYSSTAGIFWPISMILNLAKGNGVLPRWSGYADRRINRRPRG